MMTNSTNNPWNSIHNSAKRRVDAKHRFNIFWLVNEKGKYGLAIILDNLYGNYEFIDHIKGVSIIRKLNKNSPGEIYLVVNRNEDWEIFLALCLDLIQVSAKCETAERLIKHVNGRLKRWQLFLSNDNRLTLSLQKQMGLLAELIVLRDLVMPSFPISYGLNSWVGADYDKQDFALSNSTLEVKSYITTKGEIVKISSLHQLEDLRPLFLVAIGFTINPQGISILDVIHEINEEINEDDFESKEIFDNKLAAYGYIDGVTPEPFYQFTSDAINAYKVIEGFPRILSNDVKPQILSVEYTIDLRRCLEFRLELNSIF